MNRVQLFCIAVFILSLKIVQSQNLTIDTINYNNYGWQALVIDNGYIQLVIFPEIGGRVLYYGFPDDEYMWVNEDQLGKMYDPLTQTYGPWNGSSGYGGYKVWPAPQSIWSWPPPPYLAWGPYDFETEIANADSVVIYLRSKVETQKAPGLQFARRYKVFRNSAEVRVEQILINKNTDSQEWSIWDVTQATVAHQGESDYNNFSVYFPVNINEISGKSNGSYSKVNENITRFSFQYGKSGKMYSFVNKGWISFVDERDKQTYSKLFDIFPGSEHPDNNSNFEIYSSGGQYIEIEVLSPLWQIGTDDSVIYNEYWCAAHINGNILGANYAGIIRNPLCYNNSENSITGEFGVFNTGTIQLKFFNQTDEQIGSSEVISVEAAENIALNVETPLPEGTVKIKLLCYDVNDKYIGVLESCMVGGTSLMTDLQANTEFYLYPASIQQGEFLNYSFSDNINTLLIIEIYRIADGSMVYKTTITNSGKEGRFIPRLPGKGLYLVTIKNNSVNFRKKIFVE